MKARHHQLTGSQSRGRLLRAGIALGAVAALAPASIATAAPAHASQPQAQSYVEFTIQQPARSNANITFESGLSDISNQTVTGTSMLAFSASPDGFIVTSNAANNGADLIQGETTAGEPITGNALIPTGATVYASVNDGPKTAIPNGAFTIPTSASLGAAPRATRPSSTVTVSPRAVPAGSRVTISGDTPATGRPGQLITIMSDAFAARHTVDGIPAIRTQARADGTYSVTAPVPASRRANSYAVAIRYHGKLGPVTWLRVRAR
jgi:hypothetical protein